MEHKNEVINTSSTDGKTVAKIEIKEEPWWLEETSTEVKPEPEEYAVSESEMQNMIKVEAIDVPEIPHRRHRTSRALRLLETNSSIRRMRKRLQWYQVYNNAKMKLMAKQHEVQMERVRMNTELLKLQIQHQKKVNEFQQQQLKIVQEIKEQHALQLELFKTKSE